MTFQWGVADRNIMKEKQRPVTITEMHETFLAYVRADIAWKEEDKKWKEKAEPAIDIINNVRGAAKVFGWIVGFCLGISAIFVAAKYIWTFLSAPIINKTE